MHIFLFQALWGECRLEGTPNKDSEWVTEPDFKKTGVSEHDATAAEAAYDEGKTLLISRNRREGDLVKKLNPDACELSLKDAVQFVYMNYGDCFDWQV